MKTPPKAPNRISMPLRVAEDRVARREWERVLVLIGEKMDGRDINLLEDYCMSYSKILELEEAVKIEGDVITGPKGGAYMNPTLTILMNRQAHLAALRRDLYFTPKSRIEKQNKSTMTKGRSIRHSLENNDDDQD